MAALPKRKHSTRRQGKRRATIRLKIPNLVKCVNCGALKPPHQLCPACKTYRRKK